MADLIDRQATVSICDSAIDLWNGQLGVGALVAVRDAIKALPSADAVEIVRCKDCYHYDEERWLCSVNVSEFEPTDFCSYGERKDG